MNHTNGARAGSVGWPSLETATEREAVLLSLGLDPASSDDELEEHYDPELAAAAKEERRKQHRRLDDLGDLYVAFARGIAPPTPFEERLRVLRDALDSDVGGWYRGDAPGVRRVRLSAFKAWALAKGWELPDCFPLQPSLLRAGVEGSATRLAPSAAASEWIEGWEAIQRELALKGVRRSPRQIREYASRAGVTMRAGCGRVRSVSIQREALPAIVREANLVEVRKRVR